MKIYTLVESKSSLTQIITFPERPLHGMEVFFDVYGEKTQSFIPNEKIHQYVQGLVVVNHLGKDLATAIAKDYPHLFIKPLEFPGVTGPSDTAGILFSHLSGDIKSFVEERLKKIDEQIASAPGHLKLKVDRAELLCNSGEYRRAQSEYRVLVDACAGIGYLKSKIKTGLATCERELQASATIFQTPFLVTEKKVPAEKQPDLYRAASSKIKTISRASQSAPVFFPPAQDILLAEGVSLSIKPFKDNKYLNILSLEVNGSIKTSIHISKQFKQELLSCRQDPVSISSVLKARCAEEFAECMMSCLGVIQETITAKPAAL